MEIDIDVTAEHAYMAFVEAMGGRDESGRPFAAYAQLHDLHKGAWRQAVMAALTPPPAAPAAPAAPPKDDQEDEEPEKEGRSRGRRT